MLLNTVVRSVDMQKVIMLPCLQGVKTVCFTRSLAVFHETFAPIRKYKAIIHTISGNWHERISVRKANAWQAYSSKYYTKSETISKSYTLVILFCQEQKLVLFSELVNIINSDRIFAQTISSTFMFADSIHTDVEKSTRVRKILYIDDFHSNINVHAMNFSDFYHLKVQNLTTK